MTKPRSACPSGVTHGLDLTLSFICILLSGMAFALMGPGQWSLVTHDSKESVAWLVDCYINNTTFMVWILWHKLYTALSLMCGLNSSFFNVWLLQNGFLQVGPPHVSGSLALFQVTLLCAGGGAGVTGLVDSKGPFSVTHPTNAQPP
jgi:hypothetical protein